MNMKHTQLVSCVGLLVLCAFIGIAPVTISSAEVTELTVPPWVVQGETLSISGKASPNEEVWLKSSFAISLPVSDGKYSREFIGIEFPAGEKVFSVTAENVKNIRVSLSPVFWQTIEYPLDGALNATDGIAKLSISFPAELYGVEMDIHGKKDVKVYGDASDTATSVNLNTATSIKVTADSNGNFTLDINTGGVPRGEFLITAGGIEKTVEVVSTEPTPTPTPTPTPSPSPTPTTTPSSNGGDGGGAPGTTPTPSPSPSPTPSPLPSPTPTPTPTLIPTPTPTFTTTPQTTPIKNETGEKSSIPMNKTNQSPQETKKPFRIPGFESIGCIAALIIIIMLKRVFYFRIL